MENKTPLHILKIGGAIVDDSIQLEQALRSFAGISEAKILVHGGGQAASDMAERMGIKPVMLNGRRITDEATLQIVTMVYAGWINKSIVAQLQAIDCNSIGLSGADLNSIEASLRPPKPIDFGFAGDVEAVNTKQIDWLLQNGITPVCCPITHNKKGQLLNTNADTIAATVAVALSKHFQVSLWYCFEKQGVLEDIEDDHSVIENINPKKYALLKATHAIHSGMIPKMDNCFEALKKGVSKVKIGAPPMILGKTKHTTLTLADE